MSNSRPRRRHVVVAVFTAMAFAALYYVNLIDSLLKSPLADVGISLATSKPLVVATLPPTPLPPPPSPPKPSVVIAYCTYPQWLRPGEPVSGSEYMAKQLGPLIFPPSEYNLTIKTCLAVPKQLDKDVNATSPLGLELLGLRSVHMRFCAYGITSVLQSTFRAMTDQLELRGVRIKEEDQAKLRAHSVASINGVTQIFVNTINGRVVGPLLSRSSREPHVESTPGVALQFETKTASWPVNTLTLHMPYAYESFGRSRWNGNDASRVFEPHQELFGRNDMYHLRESVTRSSPLEFNATHERLRKTGFIAMVNSNCDRMPTGRIRGLFGYALHSQLGKPVHNLGSCPHNPRGAVLAGVSPDERQALKTKYQSGRKGSGSSVSDIFAHYKFSICFENSDVEGYASEKMVTPYVARSIPVYWGGGSMLHKIFNAKAFVRCDVPSELTLRVKNGHLASFCEEKRREEGGQDEMDCAEDGLLDKLRPHLAPCIRQIAYLDQNHTAYEEMLAQPLATVDEETGRLTGVWDETNYARGIKAVFDYLGHESGPQELERVLDRG